MITNWKDCILKRILLQHAANQHDIHCQRKSNSGRCLSLYIYLRFLKGLNVCYRPNKTNFGRNLFFFLVWFWLIFRFSHCNIWQGFSQTATHECLVILFGLAFQSWRLHQLCWTVRNFPLPNTWVSWDRGNTWICKCGLMWNCCSKRVTWALQIGGAAD